MTRQWYRGVKKLPVRISKPWFQKFLLSLPRDTGCKKNTMWRKTVKKRKKGRKKNVREIVRNSFHSWIEAPIFFFNYYSQALHFSSLFTFTWPVIQYQNLKKISSNYVHYSPNLTLTNIPRLNHPCVNRNGSFRKTIVRCFKLPQTVHPHPSSLTNSYHLLYRSRSLI